jgi:HEAT repeat protein
MRSKVHAALFLSLILALVCALAGGTAEAQRRGRQQPAANQSGTNDGEAVRRERPKRVFVGGSSDTSQGTRQTIKSDNPLNDYSAYRSGDRFYVVLPKADAGNVSRIAGGRGYSDMQVQQRGSDVVLSYRLRPGAKPRVEQKFNRLDVVFEVPGGAQANSDQPNVSPQTAAPPTPVGAQAASRSQQTTARPEAASAQQAQTPTAQQPQDQSPSTPAPQPEQAQPNEAGAPIVAGQPETAPQAAASPAANEIAQALPPATVPPTAIANTTSPAPAAQSGTSLGAFLLNNWYIGLILLGLLGLGLVIASRRSSASASQDEAAALPAPPAAKSLKESAAKPASPKPVGAATATSVAQTISARESAHKVEAVKESKVSKEAEVAGEAGTAKEVARDGGEKIESAAATSGAPDSVVAGAALAGLATHGARDREDEAQPLAPETKNIAPVVVQDPDRVLAETRHLLEGQEYDRAVIGSDDAMARQMVSAELLAALSGRNAERRERARAAFSEHGYFDDILRDLRSASAPAERAAAARSLGLVGDRAATSQLCEALEDRSIDVRRAAVESLATLRDPAAVPALEALIKREKKQKNKVNRKLIQRAIDSSRLGPQAEGTTAQTSETITALAPAAPAADLTVASETITSETAENLPVESESVASVATESATAIDATVESVAIESAPAEQEAADAATDEEVAASVATVESAAVESVAIEPEAVPETITPAEIADETADETATVEVASPSEERGIALFTENAEPSTVESAEPSAAEDDEVTLVAERPADLEVSHPAAAAETASESPTQSPEVTALTPFVAAEATELSSSTAEVDAAPEPAAAFEPESEARGERSNVPTWLSSAAEAPVEESATTETAPVSEVVAAPEAQAAAAQDDWIEFDLDQASEPEPPAAVAPSASFIENSAGESFIPSAVSDTTALEASQADNAPLIGDNWVAESAPSRGGVFETPAEKQLEPAAASGAPQSEFVRGSAEIETIAPISSNRFSAPPAPVIETRPINHAASETEKGIELFDADSTVPATIQQRLASSEPAERASAVADLSRLPKDEAFRQICAAFDDEAKEVRSAAARALFDHDEDRADSFTRALRESSPERRRNIGAAINSSGLASEAISQLTGESREKTYESFSILFLMAKAGEVQPLLRAIEGHPNNEVRLAVVKLLALSGQKEILPAFRRLAVRGSLPTDVRSAVMEAIYQISSQSEPTTAA